MVIILTEPLAGACTFVSNAEMRDMIEEEYDDFWKDVIRE